MNRLQIIVKYILLKRRMFRSKTIYMTAIKYSGDATIKE